MTFLGVKNIRKILDTGIVTVSAASAYAIGFFQTQQMGPLTFAIILPCLFLLLMGFVHLVLRTGRKFDDMVHDPKIQFIEAVSFAATVSTGYYVALSSVQGFSRIFSTAFVIFFLVSVYLLAYRPNS